MLNIVDKNKYILEVERNSCIIISVYDKNREGLQRAFEKIENFLLDKEVVSAKILCSNSKEEVWSLGSQDI
jgi:hypothetical protein